MSIWTNVGCQFGPRVSACETATENVREDKHYRIIEKLAVLPRSTPLTGVIELITP